MVFWKSWIILWIWSAIQHEWHPWLLELVSWHLLQNCDKYWVYSITHCSVLPLRSDLCCSVVYFSKTFATEILPFFFNVSVRFIFLRTITKVSQLPSLTWAQRNALLGASLSRTGNVSFEWGAAQPSNFVSGNSSFSLLPLCQEDCFIPCMNAGT